MNTALPLSLPFAGSRTAAWLRPHFRTAAVAGLVAVVVACAVALVTQPGSPDVAPAVPVQMQQAAKAVRGVVEAMVRTEAAGGVPAAYEFTVRLRDGSSRVSSDANPGKWRIGDHIMLIGGATAQRK